MSTRHSSSTSLPSLPSAPVRSVRFSDRLEHVRFISPVSSISPASSLDNTVADTVDDCIDLSDIEGSTTVVEGRSLPCMSQESTLAPEVDSVSPSSSRTPDCSLTEDPILVGSAGTKGLMGLTRIQPIVSPQQLTSSVRELEELCLEATRVELDLWISHSRNSSDKALASDYLAARRTRQRLELTLEKALDDEIHHAKLKDLHQYHNAIQEYLDSLNANGKRPRT
ncbi:hypothetical protein BGW38_002590 [Lunasporangiospora selenospora]|uniref:Core-binding (CB) domain-containing protein n=1 Tax=Lunasporangiospora selenospora TaxID=979761 RepID=A0A9P6FTX4_9FUNG|nr:hypothetical protein BGW38_002590 [Lunasporangiospora selenospora]